MEAIVQDGYGSPADLRLEELDKPTVSDGEVLVRVKAASVNPHDWHLIRGKPYLARIAFGLRKPKSRVRGVDVAGHIEAVGKDVASFQPGDEVFGWCRGAFAEYAVATETSLVQKPANITFDQAAAVPLAAMTALQALRGAGELHAGQRVLINGAAGGIGTFAVQIAKSFGADVTGVCSARNVDLVRSIGADRVIDYTREDFTRTGDRYDLILDNVANRSLSDCRRALTAEGTYILNSDGGGMRRIVFALVLSRFVRQSLRTFLTRPNHEDLVLLSELIEAGKLKSVIDRTYPLRQAPEAVAYLETRHARGKVIITVSGQ